MRDERETLKDLLEQDLKDEFSRDEPEDFIAQGDEPLTPEVSEPSSPKEGALKYCILVSLLLHALLFAAVPRLTEALKPTSLLKPGETVQKVRLIEEPQEETPEPPPEAEAIAERNHAAAQERVPQMMPAPRSPLGKMEPYERTASLPPTAPEKIESPKEEPVEQPREEAREEPKREEPKREELRKEDPGKEDQRKPKPVPDKHGKPVTASKPKETAPPAGPRGRKSPQPVDLRPNAAEIARGSFGGGADFLQGEADEIVLDINTKEDRFSSYLVHLKQKIQGVWIYPSGAAKAGLGGGLTVEFSIDKSGELLYVNLLDSSGHTILDESAVKAIRTAAPYNPFPARMKAKKLRIRANFIYVTQNFFRNIM